MRRQATLTTGLALLCLLDVLLAAILAFIAVLAGPGYSGAGPRGISVPFAFAALASFACGGAGFVAGLMGAPRPLVLVLAMAPVVVVAALFIRSALA